jgi:hypothetical protein
MAARILRRFCVAGVLVSTGDFGMAVIFHGHVMFCSGVMFRSGMQFRRRMMFHVIVMLGRRRACRGNRVFRVGTVFGSERLFHGRMPRGGPFFRDEMLRVPVVRGPKTFGKTIFHANSLSESPDAHASPTPVIRPRNA